MNIEQIREIESLGLPFRFHFQLVQSQEDQSLHRYTLPDFLATWTRHECLQQQDNGDSLLLYGEYVQMQALLADIGATISSTSGAEPIELIRLLSNVTPPEDVYLNQQWEHACEGAEEVVAMFEDPESECPRSLHHIKSELAYLTAPHLYPQLEDVDTIGDIAATTVDYSLVADDWLFEALLAFNVGIAIPSLHPEFYYTDEHLERQNKSNGYHPELMEDFDDDRPSVLDQDMTQIKREFHLARCRIWSLVCRPDLAYLLEGQ